jgi:hypothetical protein
MLTLTLRSRQLLQPVEGRPRYTMISHSPCDVSQTLREALYEYRGG